MCAVPSGCLEACHNLQGLIIIAFSLSPEEKRIVMCAQQTCWSSINMAGSQAQQLFFWQCARPGARQCGLARVPVRPHDVRRVLRAAAARALRLLPHVPPAAAGARCRDAQYGPSYKEPKPHPTPHSVVVSACARNSVGVLVCLTSAFMKECVMFFEAVGYPVVISRHSARASLRGDHVFWYECAAFHGASQHRNPTQIGKEEKACCSLLMYKLLMLSACSTGALAAAGPPAPWQARAALEAAFPAAPRPVPAVPMDAAGQGDGAAADAAVRGSWTRVDRGQLSSGSAWVEIQAAWQARRSRRGGVATEPGPGAGPGAAAS